MNVPRWSVSLQPRVDGWGWVVEFHRAPYGRLEGWQRTEQGAREEADRIAHAVMAAAVLG